MIAPDKKIGEIAAENPATMVVFERLHIDYWEEGDRTFAEASRSIGLTPGELFALIAVSGGSALPEQDTDWTREPLRALVDHILHIHSFTGGELARLTGLCESVRATHLDSHPELGALSELLERLRRELGSHTRNEREVLFPALLLLDEALARGRAVPAPAGNLESAIRAMKKDHARFGELLGQIRSVSFDFHIPLDGSKSYRLLMSGLLGLEQALHRQLHLENNVLLPRVLRATAMVETMP